MFAQDELKRYASQIRLSELGLHGQQRLKQARVLCVGAGGLGCPLLLYLAAAGVGTLGIIDSDTIELSNLQRQILYQDESLGLLKVDVARKQLRATNPHVNVNIYPERLTGENTNIFSDYDVVADCSDNFVTRYLINDECLKIGKPFVSASVSQFEGLCTTFIPEVGPCYRCLFPTVASDILSCSEGGVLGVLPGLLGMIQASEILKYLLALPGLLVGRVLSVNVLTMDFKEFQLDKNPDCQWCNQYRKMSVVDNNEEKSNMKNPYLISVAELKTELNNKTDLQLVDVRTPEKHNQFNIGGKLIPLADLPQHLNELDPNKLVVTYCTSGGKSMMALEILLNAGFKAVKSLDGGMNAWQTTEA